MNDSPRKLVAWVFILGCLALFLTNGFGLLTEASVPGGEAAEGEPVLPVVQARAGPAQVAVQGFKALLTQIRIIKAREMLRTDSRPNITEVAMTVGFSDLSHFERSFRSIVGQTPREYRRSAQAH